MILYFNTFYINNNVIYIDIPIKKYVPIKSILFIFSITVPGGFGIFAYNPIPIIDIMHSGILI